MKIKNKINLFSACIFLTSGFINAQNVNEFTGSFNYGVPLMTVPSDRGNNIPISASYNAGIATKQSASELGLGWNLGAGGAIYRSVSGIPDDCNSAVDAGNATVYDPSTKTFVSATGTLYFQAGYSGSKLDIYTSTYTFDSLDFEHPDYDFYNVSGPGVGGNMTPRIFHFGEVSYDAGNYTVNPYNWTTFYKKPCFYMNGDFADTLVSRHYPTTPIDGSTTFKKPDDVISGGYANLFPFLGKTTKTSLASENYDTTTKRLGAQNYIEYFTNTQINGGSGLGNFINFESGHSRTCGTPCSYPGEGIGAFRVTTPDGMVYHYSQPVYTNYSVNYNYPLKNDYTLQDDYSKNNTGTVSTSNYTITHPLGSNIYVTEYRQNLKYAYAWLLTAITGPDYNDANTNGLADSGDNGYWVSFDYKLWTKDFSSRYPDFGFDYSYQPDESNPTVNSEINASDKFTGKTATATISNKEIYYLNSIKTNSHTALFIRDYRNDEHSTPNGMDDSPYTKLNIQDGTSPKGWNGTIYDNGGPSVIYTNTVTLSQKLDFHNAEKLTLEFPTFSINNIGTHYIKIYNGPTNGSSQISGSPFYESGAPFSPITFTTNLDGSQNGSIFIEHHSDVNTSGNGFAIQWFATGRAKVVPQLEVSKIILVANDKMGSLPSISALSGSNTDWDLTSTTYSTSPMYNNDWYSGSNKTTIDANSLQTVELTQDYSLAKKYHSNVNVTCDKCDRLTSPAIVQSRLIVRSGQTANSGKLTLKEINTYELGHTKTSPSVKFDYNDASSTDNPDFDPRKTDYWGYYKSDITDSAYSGYTTISSKDLTDAWSLRTITSPLGGTISLTYESNSYDQVWKEKGGTQGPNRIYHIKAVVYGAGTRGKDWDVATEESVSDLTSLIGNSPATPTKFAFVPTHGGSGNRYESFGLSAVATQTLTGYPIRVTNMATSYMADAVIPNWTNDVSFGSVSSETGSLDYVGNGFLQFTLPVGTTVYGGGVRVKTITSTNSTSGEAYVNDYTYTGGVATAEADRFALPKLYCVPICRLKTYNPLRSYGYDKHNQNPSIGYSTVTVCNKGAVNAAQGAIKYSYITTDNGADNYLSRIQKRSLIDYINTCGGGCTGYESGDSSMIIEVINKATAYFGMMTQQQVTDVNSNIVSTEKYEYANTDQGAMVELYDIERLTPELGFGHGACAPCRTKLHRIFILRNYPVVNTKQTSYTRGASSYVEVLKRDEVTGNGIITRSVAPNSSVTVSKLTPAFRISNYAAMGPKCIDPNNTNQLSGITAKKITVDSTLSSSSDFLSSSVSTFTNVVNQRYWNSGGAKWDIQSPTLPYWIGNSSYNWAGIPGSLDYYGLFKQSEFASNTFNYTTPSSSASQWRFSSQVSLIDVNGHVLESRLFNNRFAAKKFGYTGYKYQVAQISNCNYRSFGYTGFEEYQTQGGNNYSEEIQISGSMVTSALSGAVTPKTGSYLASVTNGTAAIYKVTHDADGSSGEEIGLLRNRYYRASVWMHTSSTGTPAIKARLDGTWSGTAQTTTVTATISDSKAVTIGNWKLVYVDIFVPADYTSTGGSYNDLEVWIECTGSNTGYFDDLMLHPVEASMSAKVFDTATGRVSADISNDNYATYYIYDEGGKITEVWQDVPGSGKKKVKTVAYNFARGL